MEDNSIDRKLSVRKSGLVATVVGQWGVSVEASQSRTVVVSRVVAESRRWEMQDTRVGVVSVVGVLRFELGGRH